MAVSGLFWTKKWGATRHPFLGGWPGRFGTWPGLFQHPFWATWHISGSFQEFSEHILRSLGTLDVSFRRVLRPCWAPFCAQICDNCANLNLKWIHFETYFVWIWWFDPDGSTPFGRHPKRNIFDIFKGNPFSNWLPEGTQRLSGQKAAQNHWF